MQTWSFVGGSWRKGDVEEADFHWHNVESQDAHVLEKLKRRYGLHPLAIEDCLSPNPHAPKVDEFDDHIFVVLVAPRAGHPGFTDEFDVFLGTSFVITYADMPLPEVASAREKATARRHIRPGPDGLLYEIADAMVDGFLPVTLTLGDELDGLEDAAVDPAAASPVRQILELRTRAGKLRRVLAPQLSVIQRLSRGEFSYVLESNQIYFRDIYDHLVRIDLALEGVREDAEMAMSTYLSNLNNRMNEVMKVLSLVAALALPAAVITGVFGTNFDNVPGLHSNWGFALMLGGMAAIAISMGVYFRRRGWW